jgi:protein regulator of cytokinesis 1
VYSEKNDMTEEAHRLLKSIKQMEGSLDDSARGSICDANGQDLRITYPLTRCISTLTEKYNLIYKLHQERGEQVKSERQLLLCYRCIITS